MKHTSLIRYTLIIYFALLAVPSRAVESRLLGSGQLSSNLITATVQDQHGFVWIGTEYGLNRFDGLHTTEYLHHEHDSLSIMSNSVRTLHCDREGNLWIGYQNGLQRFDAESETFHRVTFNDTEYTPNVSDIVQLQSGRIWLIVARLGLFELDTETMTAHTLHKVTELCGTDHINEVYQDARQRIWISTVEKGIFCINEECTRVENYHLGKPGDDISGVFSENRNGVVIAAIYGKVWMFDEVHRQFVALDHPKECFLDTYDLLQRKNGDFLIATFRHGLWRIDEEHQRLERLVIDFPNSLNTDKVNPVTLMEDREENLWCGCFQRGVALIPSSPSTFGFWDMARLESSTYRIDHGAVTAIFCEHDNSLWCGMQDGSLFHLNKKGEMLQRFDLGADISSIYVDKRGTLWAGVGYEGVCRIDRHTGRTRYIESSRHNRIKSIVEGADGRLYAGLLGGGVYYLTPSGAIVSLTESLSAEQASHLRNSYINKLFIDSKKRLWIGHYLGVACFDTIENRFVDVATDPLLNASICYALIESRDGSIWIGTNNGLFVWNEQYGRYERYTTDNGLSSNMICGLAEDHAGDIWCSTFRGINRLNIQDNRIVSYYVGNGAAKREYLRGSYDSDGTSIFYGDSYGITSFTPPIPHRSIHRKVILSRMFLGDQPVTSATRTRSGKRISERPLAETDQITLPHNQSTFTLEFSTMAMREAENLRFRYRLAGLGSEWNTTPQGQYHITYDHLRPGNYTLDVYADEDGVLSAARRIRIRITHPWYATLPAYALYAVLILSVGSLIIGNIRRRRSEEINQTKLKFYVNIAHEIRSPMVMVLNPIEWLLKRTSDRESVQALQTMQRNTRRIVRLLNQFLDIRKLDSGEMHLEYRELDLIALTSELIANFSYQAEKRNIRLRFEHPAEAMRLLMDSNHFETILSNLITNALKFTPDGGEITTQLSFNTESGWIELRVSDTGPGIDEKEQERIFDRFYQINDTQSNTTRGFGIGLNLCRMLAELLGGTITADNRREGHGAIFTVRLPLLLAVNGASEEEKKAGETALPATERSQAFLTDSLTRPKRERTIRAKSTQKILVIDDDEEIRLYLEASLSHAYKILTAKDGDEGIHRALTELPDLIVSDVLMPGLNGLQLLKRIKSNPNTNHIPTILLTSKAEQSDRIEGLEYGADGYVAKPFLIEELQTLIDNLLKNRQRLRGKFSGAHQEDKIKEVELKANSDVLMERVMKIINDHLDNPELKVEMLAEEVGLSRAQLHRRLKELTGISSGEFIRNIRLKKAAELLAERKVNISQVAYMVGFSSQTHFSTAFRKFYGVSPTEYLNRRGGVIQP